MIPKRLQVEALSLIMERSRRVGIHRYSNGIPAVDSDSLASETLLHLYSDGVKIASLLGTPTDLAELFIGHALAEGYGLHKDGKVSIERSDSGSLLLDLDKTLTPNPSAERIITSSCGACNADGLEELISQLPVFSGAHPRFTHTHLYEAFQSMKTQQIGFIETGGMHAAAMWTHESGLQHIAEDIGRHNAVDKCIGMSILSGQRLESSMLLLSGRCGWDLVAKAARSGIGTIVCIGACSTLAADTARSLNMRIFSFMKPKSCVGIGHL